MTGPIPRVIAIIPARLASSRFPEKVLASETGKYLLQHVYENAMLASTCESVIVATDSKEIAKACERFAAPHVMTRQDHPSGTSRLAEAAANLSLEPEDIVINIQGDEPELDPRIIDDLAIVMRNEKPPSATVCSPFAPGETPDDPNIVKVVRDASEHAMYFSRAHIPFQRDSDAPPAAQPRKHLGIYAYTRETLDTYITLPPSPLEQTEKLEQLRLLAAGIRMRVIERTSHHHGIDTPEQYAAFVERHQIASGH